MQTATTEENQTEARAVQLEEAARQIVTTLPRMFKTVMRQAREAETVEPGRDAGDSQAWVLHALCKGPQMTSALARRFNVADPTMTRIIDGLVKRGYVERHPDATDRRRIFLTLTEPGARVGEQVHEQFRDALARFLTPLESSQLEEITRAFRHLQSLLPQDDDLNSFGSEK